MTDVGGTSLDHVIRRLMSRVMTNDLPREFNVFGRFGKESFAPTKLMEVVYRKYQISFRFGI